MGLNLELAKKAEQVAKKLSEKNCGTDSMWELFLMEAYDQITKENKVTCIYSKTCSRQCGAKEPHRLDDCEPCPFDPDAYCTQYLLL